MYRALKNAKIKADYEKRTFEVFPSFKFKNKSYERQANGKGNMVNRGNKNILAIKYTPDFEGKDFIIELIGIDYLKNKDDYEIDLIFNNNAHISLKSETIEVRLEDQNEVIND